MKQYLSIIIAAFLLLGLPVRANNVRIGGDVKIINVSSGVATVEFPLAWDNSWRDAYNRDGAWVFLKYNSSGTWLPGELTADSHDPGEGLSFKAGETDGKTIGLLLTQSLEGSLNVETICRLRWKLPDGLSSMNAQQLERSGLSLLVQAIEVVQVPPGAYYLGDGSSASGFATAGGSAVLISSEEGVSLRAGGQLVDVPAAYPKGYQGFCCMKYEVSQEQYVSFLNTLTLEQQQELLSGVEKLAKGAYLFGASTGVSTRNGIIVSIPSPDGIKPVTFACNLHNDAAFNAPDDGQALACNYLSPLDLAAYCSWSGLRPMSEAEYEKGCRQGYPRFPQAGEYAWGSNIITGRATGPVVADAGSGREKPDGGNVNAGNTAGPLRSGAFATEAADQSAAGATWWGAMEMSGNLRELCANINATLSSEVHGAGSYTPSLWNYPPDNFGVRGGSFATADSLLCVSNRNEAVDYFSTLTQRDSTVGFRAVRTFSGSDNGGSGDVAVLFEPGSIAASGGVTEVKPGATLSLVNVSNATLAGAYAPVTYNWYVNNTKIEGAMGEEFTYDNFSNTTSNDLVYVFQRWAICNYGTVKSNSVVVTLPRQVLSAGTIAVAGGVTTVCPGGKLWIESLEEAGMGGNAGATMNYKWYVNDSPLTSETKALLSYDAFQNTTPYPVTYSFKREVVCGNQKAVTQSINVTVSNITLTGGKIALATTGIICSGSSIRIRSDEGAAISCNASASGIKYSWSVNNKELTGQTGTELTYSDTESGKSYTFIRKAVYNSSLAFAEIVVNIPIVGLTVTPDISSTNILNKAVTVTAASDPSGSAVSNVYWTFNGNTIHTGTTYTPTIRDFGKLGNWTVECKGLVNGCPVSVTFTVKADQTFQNCGDLLADDEGNLYPTVLIGSQCWMAKNINIGKFTPIIITNNVTHPDSWTFDDAGIQKWCIGGAGSNIQTSNAANCDIYGGLYEWWEVICNGKCSSNVNSVNAQTLPFSSESELKAYGAKMVSGSSTLVQGICPDGWHIPTIDELTLGSNKPGWNTQLGGHRGNGYDNKYGFNNLGTQGSWWSSTPTSFNTYHHYRFDVNPEIVLYCGERSWGISVRCLRN